MKFFRNTPLRLLPVLAISAGLLFAARPLLAQQAAFELDPAKTKIDFTLGDVLHTVHGNFKAKTGVVHFDLASGNADGSFIVDATSGDSGNKTRDHKMNKEILESEKYPEVVFTPAHVSGAVASPGDSTLQVQGVFRIHGTDHALTLSVPVHVNQGELTGNLKFVVPYVAWGLKDPSTFILRVSKEVEIDIAISGRFTPGEANRKTP